MCVGLGFGSVSQGLGISEGLGIREAVSQGLGFSEGLGFSVQSEGIVST